VYIVCLCVLCILIYLLPVVGVFVYDSEVTGWPVIEVQYCRWIVVAGECRIPIRYPTQVLVLLRKG
jgi:hypothetical protein